MADLTKRLDDLPATIEELSAFVLIGKERLKAHQAKINAIKKVGMADAARRAALQDGQDAGRAVIYAEAKLGELLKAIPPNRDKQSSSKKTSLTSLPPTINKRASHVAQTIAANPGVVEAVIAAAVERDDIPTPDKVYKAVKVEAIKERNKDLRSKAASLPTGKFSVILADPPWQYRNSGFAESAESNYPTMPTDEICGMAKTVNALATSETVLFLWATNPLLPDAFSVMKAWGFEYKTNMAWIKDKARGKGWFLKSKHELLLIGTRENTPHPKFRPDSCFEADRGQVHSRKPEAVYGIIESMYDGSKIEMFCRKERTGWASHGNELQGAPEQQ